ncbi:hypothetical protein GGP41_001639 [Bipolaris sorokiniana]|uniref:JmjC domain-containing protein n=2 Tax=Cochliobolus sativus TaxID=45130 RepID=A0A8H6DZ62_COCSA|nr:uncharacterized protein COCSADRAFT_33030 [Bipolaris sorokiniana ND90Pr]EMD68066.1 hypothetical protein COCSADRAFT_33030 [Bipolaris sorokiniana ND90Pr]KAF5853038.1 hypothetical protein GGP41_001639 [Bipolaris sorokiniana]
MNNDAPTLQEIIQLTRQELVTPQKTDPIRECGRAALALLPENPELGLKLAYQKLHDVPYKEVKTCWRRLYTDATLWRVLKRIDSGTEEQQQGTTASDWIDEVVKSLDMALILAGAPAREELMELWFAALKTVLDLERQADVANPERPSKRQKLSLPCRSSPIPERFPEELPNPEPVLTYPLQRTKELSLEAFQRKAGSTETHTPCIIEDAIQHWPALNERPWANPGYLLRQTLGGRRLIPVEVGKSYTAEGWGQCIITFREFMETYMLHNVSEANPNNTSQPPQDENVKSVGYLAQHDLFAQIPSLRLDISIPDYCFCDPAPSPHLTHIKPVAKLEEPLLNAWFGPEGTVSPLHTDPYHNILAQVVGYKYVRLYAPQETKHLHPRSVDECGVDMSNTSQIDLDEAMELFPEISCFKSPVTGGFEVTLDESRKREFQECFPGFEDAAYVEEILGPGECLYLPVGWWHYVRSLTPSFSVSFWFN